MNTVYVLLEILPSMLLFYIMLCQVNAKQHFLWRWNWAAAESWAYLLFLGGSVFSFYTAFSFGSPPSLGKFMMDLGACLFFWQRGWRIRKMEGKKLWQSVKQNKS
ncbi:hypothetical protein [Wielerella bovis]|uniref:hypothetical protein n=1 Tax=Wielerella bovis TaxID=2917790 RepID=UPI002019B669|nr:hypothetical protein [Wielerella bovis]ULJ66643.1 hypothetical protein MIS31_10400 [Wielerella bovis]